jgi:hypothetical protein
MTSPYRIERERGTKESPLHDQLPSVRKGKEGTGRHPSNDSQNCKGEHDRMARHHCYPVGKLRELFGHESPSLGWRRTRRGEPGRCQRGHWPPSTVGGRSGFERASRRTRSRRNERGSQGLLPGDDVFGHNAPTDNPHNGRKVILRHNLVSRNCRMLRNVLMASAIATVLSAAGTIRPASAHAHHGVTRSEGRHTHMRIGEADAWPHNHHQLEYGITNHPARSSSTWMVGEASGVVTHVKDRSAPKRPKRFEMKIRAGYEISYD